MIDRNPDAILTVDQDGAILFANPASEDLFGQPPNTLIGINLGLPTVAGEFSEISIPGISGRNRYAEMRSEQIQWGDQEGFIVSLRDVTERREAADRIEYLNDALRAIRDVNQLITKESDPKTLVQKACDLLSAAKGFKGVWIGLVDEERKPVMAVHAGLGDDAFDRLSNFVSKGVFPECTQKAFEDKQVVVVEKVARDCVHCPLGAHCTRESGVAVPLLQGRRILGVMVISVPHEMVMDEEDLSLLEETADDIAFALNSIEIARKEEGAQEALRQSEARFRLLVKNAPLGILSTDIDGEILETNAKAVDILKALAASNQVPENLMTCQTLYRPGPDRHENCSCR